MVRKVWFQLIQTSGKKLGKAGSLENLGVNADIDDFKNMLKRRYKGRHLNDVFVEEDLEVFTKWGQPKLDEDVKIGSLGDTRRSALLVEVPRLWYQLFAARTREPIAETAFVPASSIVVDLRTAVKNSYVGAELDGIDSSQLKVYQSLEVYKDPAVISLRSSEQIGDRGKTKSAAFIVEVPVLARTKQWEGFSPDDGLERPKKRHKALPWVWEKEKAPIYCVERDILLYGGRDEATRQLAGIHRGNYNREVGKCWVIPIMDNVSGIGKTDFGLEYIRTCNALAERDDDSSFDFIRDCRTVQLVFTPGQLMDDNGRFDVTKAQHSFVERTGAFFKRYYGKIPPSLTA